VVILSSMVTQ